MTAPAGCQMIGRWRIVEADLWDRDYLNLCGPATITIGDDNNGEIAFGALQAGLDVSYSPSMVFFTWEGCDEMDEVSGDGHAELLDDGSIEITFAYHNGDEATSRPRAILLQQPARPRGLGQKDRRAPTPYAGQQATYRPGGSKSWHRLLSRSAACPRRPYPRSPYRQ